MAKLLKLRRGTTSQHSSFTGAEGEVTVDTTKDTVVVHDGSTQGGHPLVKASANEGAALLSTGESGGTKFLREDGDGSCSWQTVASVPTTITVADESSDTTCFPLFVTAATGDLAPKTGSNITFNSSTGLLTAVNLTLSGNLTVNGTTTTVDTTNTTVKDNLLELNSGATSNANDSGILIERGSTGDNAIFAWEESADKFIVGTTTAANDATGDLTITTGTLVANVEGNVTGNVTGNTSGSAGSCTGNAATATTATTATNVTVADESSDTTCFPLFATAATGDLAPKSGDNLTFNSSTGELEADILKDSKGDVRIAPILTATSGNTTLSPSEAGKVIYTNQHVIVPSASGAGITLGSMFTVINTWTNDISIQVGSGSGIEFYIANDTNLYTSNRTLAPKGLITILYVSDQLCYLSGSGVS